MAALEQDMCARADLVFVTSRVLLERKKRFNPETHLASHGVDHAHFSKALDPATRVPADVAGVPHPIIGFFGLIEDWIDVDLMAYIAEQRPGWSVVVIGKEKTDCSRLRRHPNVFMLGRKPYEELPGYCKAFDVALCPFVLNELTRNVNPIKLREYLSAGLPVVSTGIPEMKNYPSWCAIADEPAAFLAACEQAIAEDSPDKRRSRSEAMAAETWERRVAELGDHVRRVRAGRR
jgi:glycosyltransferase involved in cell wall biosynthesis